MKPSSNSILCGTDLLPNAAQAAAVAAVLARRWNKPLVLLHVADEFNAHAAAGEDLERFLQPARVRLHQETTRLAATGAAVSGELLHSQVAEQAILGYLAEHPAPLVVVSAVSKTAFDRWTLGSVSERIAEAAPAATLVVRAAAPFEAWLRGERPLKVFVAADFSASAEAALRWVGELRQLGPCEITAAYVDWPAEERDRLGVYGPLRLTANHPEIQRVLERDLRERVTAVLGDGNVTIRVESSWGRVDYPLLDLARASQADLLVVGTHQRRGLERWSKHSVSRGLLRHAPMNVACVPATAVPAPTPSLRPCRRVLAAADLSPHGGLALPYACSVVAEGGTVCLVHVAVPSRFSNSTARSGPESLPPKPEGAQRIACGLDQLHKFIPAEAEGRGIHTEVKIIEETDVARAICQAAEAFNADLVCIGAHARPGAAAQIMGSVALKVLQQSRRPVLVVWPPVE